MTPNHDDLEEQALQLTTPRIYNLMRRLTLELVNRDRGQRRHVYFVDGMYEADNQITGDAVVASSPDEAEAFVQEIRDVTSWDAWVAAGATLALDDLTVALNTLGKTPAEIDAGLEQTLGDLNGARCSGCNGAYPKDNLDDGLCEDCVNKIPSDPNEDQKTEEFTEKLREKVAEPYRFKD